VLTALSLCRPFVAPKSVDPIDASSRRLIGISPDGVPVHVHDKEIEEHIDGARLSGFRSSPS
jgi:hypothetical protein